MLAFFKQMLVSRRWEDRFGAINGILAMIEARTSTNMITREISEDYDGFLWEYLLEKAFLGLLNDEEFRVRNQSALLLKSIIGSDRSGKGV